MAPSDVPPRRVHLVDPRTIVPSTPPIGRACFEGVVDCFQAQRGSAHELSSIETADLVLAPIQSVAYGPALEALRRSPLFAKYRDRLLVLSNDDNQFPAIPGLYPSAVRRWPGLAWAAPAHYVSSHIHKFQFTKSELSEKDLAFSFVGSSRTHRVRSRIMKLTSPSSFVFDASGPGAAAWWDKPDAQAFVSRYRDVLRRSRFSVCPRGISPSSIRLFESMEAASVPIVVSDELQLPAGPDWDSFSIVVPERDVDAIPAIVKRHEGRALAMGMAARVAWEQYFSPESSAASLVAWAMALLARRSRRWRRLDTSAAMVREYSSWPLLKQKLRRWIP